MQIGNFLDLKGLPSVHIVNFVYTKHQVLLICNENKVVNFRYDFEIIIELVLFKSLFLFAPKRKRVIFVLKIICPQYTFSLPDLGNSYFSVFQNACPNLTFTCPGQSGMCLWSTLAFDMRRRSYRGRAVRASDFHTRGPRFEPRPGSSALGQGDLSSLPSLSEETLSRRSRV